MSDTLEDVKNKIRTCAGETCKAKVSSYDPHKVCEDCRGPGCNLLNRCSECSHLSNEQFSVLESKLKENRRKKESKRSKTKTIKVTAKEQGAVISVSQPVNSPVENVVSPEKVIPVSESSPCVSLEAQFSGFMKSITEMVKTELSNVRYEFHKKLDDALLEVAGPSSRTQQSQADNNLDRDIVSDEPAVPVEQPIPQEQSLRDKDQNQDQAFSNPLVSPSTVIAPPPGFSGTPLGAPALVEPPVNQVYSSAPSIHFPVVVPPADSIVSGARFSKHVPDSCLQGGGVTHDILGGSSGSGQLPRVTYAGPLTIVAPVR